MAQRSHHSSSLPTPVSSMPSAAPASSPYCYGHSSQGALFCGLRKSLREILRSKHSSPMYSVKPMMYSQRDMFFSPRSRRNEEEEVEVPSSSMWEGFQSSQHDPKAHLHFNVKYFSCGITFWCVFHQIQITNVKTCIGSYNGGTSIVIY